MPKLYNSSGMFPPYAALAAQTNENYKTAISYYSQRRVQFEAALARGGLELGKEYVELLAAKAKIFNDTVLNTAMRAITQGSMSGQVGPGNAEYEVPISEIYKAAYIGKDSKPHLNTYKLGLQFEQFITNNALSSAQLQKASKAIEMAQNLALQHVGAISQKAWSTGISSDTRTDVALSSHQITNDTLMELSSELDIEQDPLPGETAGDMILDAVSRAGIDISIYGFQLKTYKSNSDDKRWQNAQAMADRITELFSSAGNRTWSSNYVVNYPTWFLSKYLINIINPVNIGNITLDGIEYMDEWLQHVRLYMETAWAKSTGRNASGERGGGVEVLHPYIASRHVLIRQIGNQTFKGFSNHGNMRNAAYEKNIKVASIKNL